MKTLYNHIAELMDKSMQQASLISPTGNDINDACRLLCIQKEVHAQAEILLHMTRYYKDQIPHDYISEEVLESLVNDMTSSMRELQNDFFKEAMEKQ